VRRNLAGGQAFGIQRQHHLIHARQPPLAFLDDLGFERRGPVTGTSSSTGPVVPVNTVLARVPLRILPVPAPAGS
jgi:hypothetical protein